MREAREDDLSAAEPSVLPTVGSLEAECDALRVQLAESRAAHAADAEALRASVAHVESLEETIAGLRGPCDGCAASMDAMVKATAECDALRKQIAALEEAATAPPTKSRK
ncbi:MAG: hypothetical protein EKK55_10180 [Rhodocyclaceae bacterium]|nr:MAG: hypothetical protein EKK55_10180 [Rhodocyclaceae bacterium]